MTQAAAPRLARSALSIAGLDPSGGAGILADVRAFRAAGAWGAAVCAVLTVQSPSGLRASHPVDPELLLAQAREIFAYQRVFSLKTGALGTAANVRAVAALVRERPRLPLVVDPVLCATRSEGGARLLDEEGLLAMRELCSLGAIVTPNAAEAEALLGARLSGLDDQREAARELVGRGALAALIKGGHLHGREAVDVLAVRGRVVVLRGRRRDSAPFHGAGCCLSSLLAGRLARDGRAASGERIEAAARFAKRRVSAAIGSAVRAGPGLLLLPL